MSTAKNMADITVKQDYICNYKLIFFLGALLSDNKSHGHQQIIIRKHIVPTDMTFIGNITEY